MIAALQDFRLDAEPLLCVPFGSGHINDTYLVVDATAREYILQRINRRVFRDPEALMKNVSAVTEHLRGKADAFRESLRLLPTKEGELWLVDGEGEYWRLYAFVTDSLCLNQAESPDDFRESAVAFGAFQRQLADFDASRLSETIPRFHDTPSRYAAFHEALRLDTHGRAKALRDEIDFYLAREEYGSFLVVLQSLGDLPLRVTHNDTKLNNVLFDRETRRALCVIDLDTVMPGLAVNDFGDSIRFGASTAAEDERDLGKVHLSLPLYRAYAEGFLSACGGSLTEGEKEHLADGARMMTLECGLRFLTDYLAGDTYFHVAREGHNLDRCRTQMRLLAEMEAQDGEIRSMLRDTAGKCSHK